MPALRWRLCAECSSVFARNWASLPLASSLPNSAEPMLLLDGAARLLACNRSAEAAFGAPSAALMGLAPGELLGCDNAEAGACGSSPDCRRCSLRQALLYTQQQDRDCERLPVLLPVLREGLPRMRCLSISTRRQKRALRLQLEDDGFLPLR